MQEYSCESKKGDVIDMYFVGGLHLDGHFQDSAISIFGHPGVTLRLYLLLQRIICNMRIIDKSETASSC